MLRPEMQELFRCHIDVTFSKNVLVKLGVISTLITW